MVAGEIAGGSRLAIDSATSSVRAAPRYGAHTCAGCKGQGSESGKGSHLRRVWVPGFKLQRAQRRLALLRWAAAQDLAAWSGPRQEFWQQGAAQILSVYTGPA